MRTLAEQFSFVFSEARFITVTLFKASAAVSTPVLGVSSNSKKVNKKWKFGAASLDPRFKLSAGKKHLWINGG